MNGDGAVIVFRRGGGALAWGGAAACVVLGLAGLASNAILLMVAGAGLTLCLLAALKMYEVRLDTAKRRYAIRKREWNLSVTESEGPFDEIDGVKVGMEQRIKTRTYRRSGPGVFWTDHDASLLSEYGDTVTRTKRWNVWAMRLAFRNKQQTEPLAECSVSQELAAYLEAERLAKALRLDLIDVTGPGVRRVPWNRLDVRLIERMRAELGGTQAPRGADLLLPPGSHITMDGAPGSRVIRMSVPRIAKFFTALACYVAGVVLLAFIANTQDVPGGMLFVNGMIALGVLLFAPMLFVFTARETIREEPHAFVFLKGVAGIHFFSQRMTKGEIEEIEVRVARSGPGYEVAVRSDKNLVRAGRTQELREAQWLKEMLCAMLAGR
jgi:hypothetical protein